jgi:hypothetical protein
MEKKEFPKAEGDFQPQASGISGKLSGLYGKSFAVIKFILGVCLLPFVYSSTVAFLNEFSLVEKPLQNCFWSGIITLLMIYLFVWEPAIIYTKGYKLLELIFNFFKPLVRVAPYLLPIYAIILFIAYALLSLVVKSRWLIEYSIFLFGVTITLHLIFSAKAIRAKKGDFLKANYIFGFSFIYAVNLMLLAFCLNLIFKDFSFVNFFNNSFQLAKNIFGAVFKQLFLR